MTERPVSGYRLSPQQRRLASLDGGAGYRAQAVVNVAEDVGEAALGEAVRRVADRHEVLRTTYVLPAGRKLPVQVVSAALEPEWRTFSLPNGPSGIGAFDELLREEGRTFDLERGPVLRLCLTSGGDAGRRLIVTAPAIATDAAGLRALVADVSRALGPVGDDAEQDADPIQYPDAAEVMNELAEDRSVEQRTCWRRESLGPLPGPVLGLEARPESERAFEPRWTSRRLDAAALRLAAASLGVGPAAVLLSAWQALLWRLTGAEVLVVGVGLEGRTHAGLDQAIGLFARYLPLTARLEAALPFADAVRNAQHLLAEAAEWQEFFSWERVAEAGAEPVLVSIGFDSTEAAASSGPLALDWEQTSIEPFRVRLSCTLSGGVLTACLVHDDRFVSAHEAARLVDRYERILVDAVQRPEAALGALEVLPDSERSVLIALNATDSPPEAEATFVDLFEAQAARTPHLTAVVCGTESVDFAGLDARANRLAHALRQRGIGPDVPVGLCLQRSVALIEALVGILKSGGAYVPLDPVVPAARLGDVLRDVGARLVVTEEALLGVLPAGPWETLCLDRDRDELRAAPESGTPSLASAQHLAYVVHTSGSTGRPKGVAVTHGGLVNYVRFILGRLEVRPGWTFGLAATIAADLGHTCLYPSLASGGCLHVLARDVVTDAAAFARASAAHRLDVLKILPSHFAALLASGDPSILPREWLVFGGEALPMDLCRRVAALGGACRILNHYGPTETTVGSLTWCVDIAGEGEGTAPIGRPIPRTEAHVFDHTGRLAPLGVAGELYLGGAGLARGYWGRPDQTAERFVPHPYATRPGERLYRTGDLARCRREGTIEFLGRTDHQVKIRGHRVEPGEVEATLLGHPDVTQAVVVARREDSAEPRLVAYIVGRGSAHDTLSIRSFLSERLPEHMIPSAFVTLPALPRGPSGKVDREALPAPETPLSGYLAPRNETERSLTRIWAAVLRTPRVGIHDDYFELGGDSIVSIQIAARAAAAGLELTPLQIFRHPTVARLAAVARPTEPLARSEAAVLPAMNGLPEEELAALLSAIGEAGGSGERAPVGRDRLESVHALSPLQQGMLFHCVYDAPSRPYVTQVGYTLPADTDVAAFIGAWQRLTERHTILRSAFAWEGLEEPLQVVLRNVRVPVARHDLSALGSGEREARLAALAESDLESTSRPGDAPVFRLTLARVDGGAHRCLFTYHHLLLDGWSEVILGSELKAVYEGLRVGTDPLLAPTPPYSAYVEWVRGQDLVAAEAFWRNRLSGFDSPTPLPGLSDEMGPPTAPLVRERSLSRQATASLQGLARRSRLTLNTLVQGAWALTLGHGCDRDDVVFGATLSGRPATLAGAESILGPFINTLPVRVRIDDAAEVGVWLAALQEAQLELRAYEFSPLVHVQRWSDVPAGRRLFDSLLVFQSVPAAEGDPGLEVDDVVVRDGATSFPLSLDVRPGAELLILASHDPERLGAAAVERLLDGLETALAAFAGAPSVGAVRDRLREVDQRRQARADDELAVSSRERLRHAVRRTVRVAEEER